VDPRHGMDLLTIRGRPAPRTSTWSARSRASTAT
jgi:hypothetical protein